ncbi:MAG: cation transporter [Salinivirgaceae bacterium]|nr:cation transporter [Salinivirgaceae bacterium]
MNREQQIYRVTWVGFFANLFLSVGKIAAGIVGRSGAMIADGIHSISDFATDLVVMIFVKVSAMPKDDDHDYGHGKFETLATIIIGMALFVVAVGIFWKSIKLVVDVANGQTIEPPEAIAFAAAAVSIAVKEGLYRYTKRIGEKVGSQVVVANAWHHRSDALSSIGTLLGIGGAYFLGQKWAVLDPIAAIIVSLLIAKVAYDLIKPGIGEMLERSLPKEQEDEIESIVLSNKHFSDVHNLKTRRIGSGIAIEMHVRVPGSMTVSDAHEATDDVEHRLREHYGQRTQVILHVEPRRESDKRNG